MRPQDAFCFTGKTVDWVFSQLRFKGSGFWCSPRSMANKLIRHYGRGHLHFIKFDCYGRLLLLCSVRARNAFVHFLGEVRDRYRFFLVSYGLMPEHTHLLISGRPGAPSLAFQGRGSWFDFLCLETRPENSDKSSPCEVQ